MVAYRPQSMIIPVRSYEKDDKKSPYIWGGN